MSEINLNLSIEKVNLVIAALAELPFKVSNELINEIHSQASIQINPEEAKD